MLQDITRYKTLIIALVQRHLLARYRGSVLGFFWSLLNPLCLMVVYTVVFHYYMRIAQGENYEVMLFSGLLPWIWMSSALSEGTSSLVSSGHLITKSMFPAHILVLVSVLSTGINFLLSLLVLFLLLFFFGINITLAFLLLPVVIIINFFFLYGIVLLLASLNVLYRDIQHLLGNVLTVLFFLCPIVYSLDLIPQKWKITVYLNPFADFTLCYRSIILNGQVPDIRLLLYLVFWSIIVVFLGSYTYKKLHERFAEML